MLQATLHNGLFDGRFSADQWLPNRLKSKRETEPRSPANSIRAEVARMAPPTPEVNEAAQENAAIFMSRSERIAEAKRAGATREQLFDILEGRA